MRFAAPVLTIRACFLRSARTLQPHKKAVLAETTALHLGAPGVQFSIWLGAAYAGSYGGTSPLQSGQLQGDPWTQS